MRAAHEVSARLAALYPGAQLLGRGVVHVTATVRVAGARHVLAIGPHAPKSEADFFVLAATRARADALITSARNLRSEPDLRHDFPAPWAEALGAYRSALGKPGRVVCAILTRDGELPRDHVSFEDGTPKLVITSRATAARLGTSLADLAEVVGVDDPGPEAAIRVLAARGHALISLEAGPSTLAPLYADPGRRHVDELLLSTFEAALSDPGGLGPALPSDAALVGGLRLCAESRVQEPAGPFHFACYQRAPA
jgi:riboflavin biosynthesis pyrimidine reductase